MCSGLTLLRNGPLTRLSPPMKLARDVEVLFGLRRPAETGNEVDLGWKVLLLASLLLLLLLPGWPLKPP